MFISALLCYFHEIQGSASLEELTTFVRFPPSSRWSESERIFGRLAAAATPPKNPSVLVGGDDGGRRSPVPVAVVGAAEPLQFGRVLPGDRISLHKTPKPARSSD